MNSLIESLCRAARRAPLALLLGLVLLLGGCARSKEGSPEAVADAFVDAYFRRADQPAAKQFTALGASRMLDEEIEEVAKVRDDGYNPGAASLDVSADRGERSSRGKRVRFDYSLKFKDPRGDAVKHADIELAEIDGQWKVVRIAVGDAPAPAAAE